MNNQPLVSIITPCYNGEKFMERYFESILAQTYTNIELIFVNDGSKDCTEKIAMSYSEKLKSKGVQYIYIYQENAGQAAAMNKGLKIFSGKYLAWVDSDDVMTAESIKRKVAFLEKNPDYGMVRSNGLYFNEKTKVSTRICDSNSAAKEEIFEDLLVLKTYGCCGCYMLRTQLFNSTYPDKEIYDSRCGQNWQILVPAASRTKCGYIDEDLYIVYEMEESHSRTQRNFQQIIQREQEFKNILIDAINRSNCDIEKYSNIVKERCARNEFYYAIHYGEKKVIKSSFCEIKKYGKVSLRECFLYFKYLYVK